MTISLIHPSRGRAQKAFDTVNYWYDNSCGHFNIQHILSLDSDDSELKKYFELFQNTWSQIIVNENTCVVEATNIAAKLVTRDILIYLSDDFKCPKNWDELIIRIFNNISGPILIKVDDCLQKFNVDVLTIPIMNRELYNKLGYFFHPGYKSMFVDQDLYHVCKNNKWIYPAANLHFPHEHPANGKAQNDEIYKRSAANWNQGKELYHKRMSLNFPL